MDQFAEFIISRRMSPDAAQFGERIQVTPHFKTESLNRFVEADFSVQVSLNETCLFTVEQAFNCLIIRCLWGTRSTQVL